MKKEEINEYLSELVRIFDKKEKYCYHHRDDPDYYGIKNIENVFGEVDEKDYYKPMLAESAFKSYYKIYESRGNKDKNLSVKQNLYTIIPYLIDMINNHKTEEWKFQLCMRVNFISSKDSGEMRIIFVWSDNEEVRWGNETDDIINELFKSFLDNYQKEEQIMRRGSDFIFESIHLLDYLLHKISLKRGKPYIKSPESLINKRETIHPQNNDDKCFQYAMTVALNHENIGNNAERISKIKLFINQYNSKDIDFPVHRKEDR